MNTSESLRAYAEELSGALDPKSAAHLSEDELLPYLQRRLQETERERVRSHLAECEPCMKALGKMTDSFGSLDEMEGSDFPRAGSWKSLWNVLRAKDQEAPLRSLLFRSQAVFPAAAGLLIVLMGVWTGRLWQENHLLRSELQGGAHVKRLEQENQRLREQVSVLKQNYDAQLTELNQPQVNTLLFHILSRETRRGSADESKPTEVKLLPGSQDVALILHGAEQPIYPNYLVEMLDQKGQIVWRADGLKRDREGNFILRLNRTFLNAGQYHFKVYGRAEGWPKQIAEYVVAISLPA